MTIIASVIGQAVKINQIVEKERQELIDENIYLKQELKTKYRLKNVIGNSEKMLAVYDAVERVSKSNATVLLRGERHRKGTDCTGSALQQSKGRSAFY